MIDIALLKNDIQHVVTMLNKRNIQFDTASFTQLEEQRKTVQSHVEQLQATRNKGAKDIGQAKSKGESTDALMQQMVAINSELDSAKSQLDIIQTKLQDILLHTPNIPHDSVPNGKDENDNLFIKQWGEQLRVSTQDHVEIGATLGMDIETAAQLSGSRFTILRGPLAKLHRALAQFMLDTHITNHGYQECYVPYLVHPDILQGTGQLPKFADDLYKCQNSDHYLIPTSEVPLTNFVRNTIVQSADLPIKLTAHTPCFRQEAGSYGRDTRGMLRQHQFDKVEMVQIVTPETSEQAHEEMLQHAENIMQQLELPYRVVVLCGGDLGFSAAKTYDIEVWLPSQNTYREISSISNCTDFQARRMQARVKTDKGNIFLHTLNGSGVAVGRALLAILENHVLENGDIAIPKALQPYCNNQSILPQISNT